MGMGCANNATSDVLTQFKRAFRVLPATSARRTHFRELNPRRPGGIRANPGRPYADAARNALDPVWNIRNPGSKNRDASDLPCPPIASGATKRIMHRHPINGARSQETVAGPRSDFS